LVAVFIEVEVIIFHVTRVTYRVKQSGNGIRRRISTRMQAFQYRRSEEVTEHCDNLKTV